MPCNLAVTITKALVLPEQLQQLLIPEIVTRVITAYIEQHREEYGSFGPLRTTTRDGIVTCYIGRLDYRIMIANGQVSVNFPPYKQTQAEKLSEELSQLLSRAADQLFASQVQQSLKAKFGRVRTNTATVDNQGTPQQVTVFSLEI